MSFTNLEVVAPWAALLLLGALHGINPGMGWLFAVALGLQEERATAVWKALLPLAIGHACAVAIFVVAASAIGLVVPLPILRTAAGAALLGFGCYRLFYRKHPRYGGMRVGQLQLAIWSCIMASAHGAGLMVVPFVLHDAPAGSGHHAHAIAAGISLPALTALNTTLIHSAGYILVTGVTALLVYKKAGLHLLRTAWVNLDVIWAFALIATSIGILLL